VPSASQLTGAVEGANRVLVIVIILLAALTLVVPAPPAAAQVAFTEVGGAAGVGGDTYRANTLHGLGVVWIDYNRDTWPDLFMVNGDDQVPHLFRNEGDGSFTKVDELLPALPNVEMMGAVYGDIDGDGDDDVFVYTDNRANTPTAQAGPPKLLLVNQWTEIGGHVVPGQPLFVEGAAAAGVDDLLEVPILAGPAFRSPSAAFFDYDRDGDLDLFVAHWMAGAEGFEGHPNLRDRLYRNRGDGTFEDVTASSGIDLGTDQTTRRPSLLAWGGHLDGDLWPDLWVGNIHLPLPYHQDQIYQNQGTDGSSCADDHCFIDRISAMPGIGDDDAVAMGMAVADVELDGDWDVYITDLYDPGYETSLTPFGNPLYLNTGSGFAFADNSAPSAGVMSWDSWGTNFLDVDLDGYEDLFVAMMGNLRIDELHLNDGDGTFTDASAAAGFNLRRDSRGSAAADYDRDGDVDLGVVEQDGVLHLWRNDTTTTNHWFAVRLVATTSNRSAIGAVVSVTAGGLTMMRQVTGGNSAHSQDDPVLHFGLATATTVEQLQVQWPSGLVTNLSALPADTTRVVVEDGAGNDAPWVAATAPVEGGQVDPGTPVTFRGLAVDAESGDLTASLAWTSDRDGTIGTGATFTTSTLSNGPHVVTARATDGGGASGSHTTTILVGNATPAVRITQPTDGSSFGVGQSVSFTGTATDVEDGVLTAQLTWTSSLDGVIGTGGSFSSATLSTGAHTITAAVTDADGATGEASLTLTVANAAPVVEITEPAAGTTVYEGVPIAFAATATDVEDGVLTAGLAWTSDRDGQIGSGGAFSTAALSVGTHVVTAAVADGDGLPGASTVSVTIRADTRVFVPGEKLLVKEQKSGAHSLSLLAKSTALVPPPACATAGELVIEAAGSGTPLLRIPLDATLWKPIKAAKPELGCKYGPGPVVKKVQLKTGKLLKLSAGATDLGVPLAADPRPVRLELRHGEQRHCFAFGGSGVLQPGKKLQAKQAAAPTVCPGD
jgi:hypothetical protein